jgi:hypothetical protein
MREQVLKWMRNAYLVLTSDPSALRDITKRDIRHTYSQRDPRRTSYVTMLLFLHGILMLKPWLQRCDSMEAIGTATNASLSYAIS